MAKEHSITGIDIGGSKIRTVVGAINPETNNVHIIGVGVSPSNGLRKGAVVDAEEVINNIGASLEDAERMSGVLIHSAFLGIGGAHIESFLSRGVISVGGNEINESDVGRVLEAAQAVSIPPNRRILHTIPKNFSVDDQYGIKSPIGMTGIRLEVEAHIITGQIQTVNNVEKCSHQAGLEINDIVPSALAAAEAVLSRRQKELGSVLINIGSGSTSITVFEEGSVIHTAVLPVGGESVTNDLAIGLRTSVDTAEKIKIEYGTTLPGEVSEREQIDLSLLSKLDDHKVTKKQLADIISARYHEIFTMVKEELKSIQKDGMLPAGAILVGSAVKMPGTVDIARDILGLPAQIGFPFELEGIVDKIDDPSYATALGLVLWGSRQDSNGFGIRFGGVNLGGSLKKVGAWFKNLLP